MAEERDNQNERRTKDYNCIGLGATDGFGHPSPRLCTSARKGGRPEQVYDSTLESYQIEENVNFGKVLVPKADGQYPVIIFMHGSGGLSGVTSSIYAKMEKWVGAGYADPVVLVFTDEEDAHLMLGYGKGEAYQFSGPNPDGAANRYYNAINANEKNKNKFLMYKAPAKDPEGNDLQHGYNVFYREFFAICIT